MYNRVASNVRKSWILIVGFTLFVVLIGLVFGYVTNSGFWGVAIAAIVAIAMTWGSYFSSDKVALSMSHARPAEEKDYQQLHNIVEALSLAAGIPKPKVYIVDDPAPNAFATGRNPEHAAIAVTTGLLEKMDRDELEGVLAHELSHVKNRDTLVMTLAVTLVGVIVLLADFLLRALWWGGFGGDSREGNNPLGAIFAVLGIVLLFIAPVIAQVLQFAISRQREFLADVDGVFLTRYPDGLIHALQKLDDDPTVVRTASRATAHLWIESPIARQANGKASKQGAWLNRLFDTHPPLQDRIRALEEAEAGGKLPEDATARA
ncbi:MAG: heat shock protein HtpX [Actinomycetota bacterium]|jgi:heat shock protein HtpX|nr:heat shock protein HtpX [Actinomycetota bacterium]